MNTTPVIGFYAGTNITPQDGDIVEHISNGVRSQCGQLPATTTTLVSPCAGCRSEPACNGWPTCERCSRNPCLVDNYSARVDVAAAQCDNGAFDHG